MTTSETARCSRCGRTLRTAASREAGIGPTCAKRLRQAAVAADFTPAQVEKAREVADLGAVRRVRRNAPVFEVVASDGATRYTADAAAGTCDCKAGERGFRCYHLLVARWAVA